MVKCIDCGYLANRNKESRELVEVERSENGDINNPLVLVRGSFDSGLSSWLPVYDDPVCFARANNLQSEIRVEPVETSPESVFTKKIRGVITKERTCGRFTDWQQGLTPKEHMEMLDRKTMLEYQAKQQSYLVKVAGIFAIIAGIVGAGIGSLITWLLTRGGH